MSRALTEMRLEELLNFKYVFPHLKKYDFIKGVSKVKKTWKILMLELRFLKL